MGERVAFRILGPLEVLAGDRFVAIGGPRQRTVLAMLLLSPDRVVSVNNLVEAVWKGNPPATVRGQVAICIAGLRKLFRQAGCDEEIIVRTHPGYMLLATDHRIDARDFANRVALARDTAEQGQTAEAAEMLSEALGLWRGLALEGISSPAVETEAARLEERRLSAYEQRAALYLELGEHEKATADLTNLVREHPLRERARAQLMLALYRSGRRAEALEVFREGRERSIDELGLEPGPALQDLHDEMLHDEPSLSVVGSPGSIDVAVWPAQLPPGVSTFVGREPELVAMNALVDEWPTGGSPSVGLITGPAGVGKTALAVRWARAAAPAFPDGQLFADLRGYDEAHQPVTPAAVLDQFLRSLGTHSGQVRAELSERIALYRSILDGRRVLIVLDNVATFDQIQPLLPGGDRCCVLVTSRDQLGELGRFRALRLRLGALTRDEAILVVRNVVGAPRADADPGGVARLAELCDRLPLALQIAGARLATKPHWAIGDLVGRLEDERRRLDELSQGQQSVRVSFGLSYHRPGNTAAMLYRRLSLLDAPDFPAWVGAALLRTGLTEAENLIERLVDAHLLHAVGQDATGTVRYRFRALQRLDARERAQEEDDPAEQRDACESAFGGWLALAEQAHRRIYGGDYTVIHGAARRWSLDQAYVDRLLHDPFAWFEAERVAITKAVRQAAWMNLHDVAWDIAMTSTTLFEARNYLDDWRRACTTALGAARKAGNTRGEAAMLYSLGTLKAVQQRYDEAAHFLLPALQLFEHAEEQHGRALVLRNLAVLDRMQGDHGLARQRCEEARATFQAVGDRYAEAHVLGNLAQIELEHGDPAASVGLAAQAVEISRVIRSRRGEAQSLYRLAQAYLARGQLDRASNAFGHVLRILHGTDDRLGRAYALCGLGETQLLRGRLAEAEASLTDALNAARSVADRFVEGRANLALGRLYLGQDQPAEARKYLDTAGRLFAEIRSPPWQAEVQQTIRTLVRAGPDDPDDGTRPTTPPRHAGSTIPGHRPGAGVRPRSAGQRSDDRTRRSSGSH